jgi:vancomycin resistance protein YoaR
VRVAIRPFVLVPQTIGYELDVEQTLARALAAGREGNALVQLGWWLGRFGRPRPIAPVAGLDRARLAERVEHWEAEAIEDRPFDGGLAVKEDAVEPDYPRAGRGVVRPGLEDRLLDAIGASAIEPVELPLGELAPRRDRAAVDRATGEAKALTRAPVVLLAAPSVPERPSDEPAEKSPPAEPAEPPEPVTVRFARQDLLAALRTRWPADGKADLELYFDPPAIDAVLAPLRAKIEKPPRSATFVVEKRDELRLVPGTPGVLVDAAKVAAALLEAARTADRKGVLPLEQGAPPKLGTEQAAALKITKLVGQFTTSHPCCQPRVQNIHRIADVVDGTVVLPGDTLSLNALVGQRTKAAGYVMAPAIEEGEMVDALGGGVSQFTTTLFNAAFRAGYDVVERAPHTFYFRRYPMGLDATLSYPKPDLVIRNDTEAGLLVKTEHTKTSITVKLFGDTGKRKVDWKKSAPFDLTQPPIKYLPNPERKFDTEKVKYSGQAGWSLYVSRTVTPEQGEPKTERRKVTYKPRPRELEVHPCRIPKGEEGYTGVPCPEPVEPEDEADAGVLGPPADDREPSTAEELIPPSLLESPDG